MLATFQGIIQNPVLILQIVATILGAFLVVSIFNILISRLEKRGDLQKDKLVYMKRFFQIIIYLVAIMLILGLLDQDITAAIAGLGIGALIIGFGLQDIIENWVSGVLLISGKIYSIGDVIKVGDLTGTVTDIALRTTKLKTYDRNEIIIPNSLLMKEKIINLTGGTHESVAAITFSVDYTMDTERVKSIIENILKSHKSVIVSQKKKREIRFIFRNSEWTNNIETLFWINDPSNEEFIKSNISEQVQEEFKKENILPPIPSLLRKDYMVQQKASEEQESG
jgi:small-conductance mechanosensitive channel